ncbi:hypothetical protein C0581_01275 [Candidatus Parcubacteria bacterium]|nr:MAG: hypothetical protein C0581_01275 [Candidatus Parcubacteria bacterium]
MSKIAIDIALLPPDGVMDICVELSQNFPDKSGRSPLNKVDNLPHISLFMGMVEENELNACINELEKLVKNIYSFEGHITELVEPEDKKDTAFYFRIEKSEKLNNLHKILIEGLSKYFPKQSTKNMYFGYPDENIDEQTFFWVDNYITGSSLEKFNPHITLKGCAKPTSPKLPITFQANRIALCHLGDYCTCRKILYETRL